VLWLLAPKAGKEELAKELLVGVIVASDCRRGCSEGEARLLRRAEVGALGRRLWVRISQASLLVASNSAPS
jgi:hypothetical protein